MSNGEINIPRDYNSWKQMIIQCEGSLSSDFIEKRLQVLKSNTDDYTQKFKQAYGEDYLKAVISWFEKAKNDIG